MTKSTTSNPDLDWSQVKETLTMLCLAIAQIRASLTEGDSSINHLSESFTQLLDSTQHITDVITEQEEKHSLRDDVTESTQVISRIATDAIMSFQFYDKLNQRLTHVSENLEKLGELIGNAARLYNPSEWKRLQEDIQSDYSMESERVMFEAIMHGASVSEAINMSRNQAQSPAASTQDDDDIELF